MGKRGATIRSYRKNLEADPRDRNLIILMDGTWNDENEGLEITNVAKLHRCLQKDSEAQITRYYRGVGNDYEFSRFGRFFSGLTGFNERQIRRNAYATIVKEYQTGDRIFIFGFSRGAASARMLAADLNRDGIPQTITVESRLQLNHATKQIESRFYDFTAEGPKKEVEVAFLGVWDTIGAFGIPVKVAGIKLHTWDLFHDMHLAPNVKKAVHLVAVDETRKPFTPALMNKNDEVSEEIWLPGVHSDVGGGYAEDQLARHSLGLMIKKLKACLDNLGGQPILFNNQQLEVFTTVKEDTVFHFHGLGWGKSIRKIFVQVDDKPSPEQPWVHSSVGAIQQSPNAYSLVTKKPLFSSPKTIKNKIRYNPINLKMLNKNYIEVD